MEESLKEIRSNIFKLSWPSIMEQILVMTVGIVSTIFTGHLGKDFLTAVGMVNMIILLFQTVYGGFSTGASVIVSRYTGKRDYNTVKNSIMHSLIICEGIGIAITILAYILAKPTMSLFFLSPEKNVYKIALYYYKIVLLGIPFMVLDLIIAACQRGAGDTKTPMYISLVVNIINILLNSTLIFGMNFKLFHLPALGIKGSAYAVTVSRISGGIMRVISLYVIKGKINLSFCGRYKFDKILMLKILKLSIPSFIEQFIMQTGYLIGQAMLVSMGSASSAVYQVGSSINSVALMPTLGFSIASTSLIGQYLGKRNIKMSEKYAKESIKISVIIISILGALMLYLQNL